MDDHEHPEPRKPRKRAVKKTVRSAPVFEADTPNKPKLGFIKKHRCAVCEREHVRKICRQSLATEQWRELE